MEHEGPLAHVPGLLRQWRNEAKISQRDLAEQLGMSPSNFSQWENGKSGMTVDSLSRVMKVLGKEVKDLATGDELTTSDSPRDPRELARALWETPEQIGELFGLEPGDGDLDHRDSKLDRETRLRLKSAEFRKRTLIATLEYLLEWLEEDDQEASRNDQQASGEAG